MVYGLDRFAEFFKGLESRFVLIGGTACHLVLNERGENFRATKDLDIVLLTEALDAVFVDRFVEFIKLGNYNHICKSTGKDEYYRFENPVSSSGYPQMIELFSKRPEYLTPIDTHLAPIHVNEAPQSLSAIFLDDDYYSLLESGITFITGIPVLSIDYLPVFKMKAWLELTKSKAAGLHVNSFDLSKHKNDVLRLTSTFDPDLRIEVSTRLKKDINDFLANISLTDNDLRNLGIKGFSTIEMTTFIASAYNL